MTSGPARVLVAIGDQELEANVAWHSADGRGLGLAFDGAVVFVNERRLMAVVFGGLLVIQRSDDDRWIEAATGSEVNIRPLWAKDCPDCWAMLSAPGESTPVDGVEEWLMTGKGDPFKAKS